MTITFGTDGWRAVISDEFTFANVRHVAQAIAEQTLDNLTLPHGAGSNGVNNNGVYSNGAIGNRAIGNGAGAEQDHAARPTMVVGYDTRFLSDRYAMAVAEVLAANGIAVLLTRGDTPTPITSFAVVDKQAVGGVMITASHNPPRYNGIKLKAAFGGSASPAACKDVERRIAANLAQGREPLVMDAETALADGWITRFDPFPAYGAHLRTLINFDTIRHASLNVAVDAMYGTGRKYLRALLEDAGCTVTELRGEMNPGFNGIHPEPIARHLQPLIDEMMRAPYHIGLATDGDADRIGAVDSTGRFVDPHCIMALALEYLVLDRGKRGCVVKTVSTTQMLNRLALRYDLQVHETPVGFNHICDYMLAEEVLLGGEESGGISIIGHIPEGDGILMAMLLTEIVAARGKSLLVLLDELMAAPDVGHFSYARRDQPVRSFRKADLVRRLTANAPASLAGSTIAQISGMDGVKFILADDSWLLIRPSGTEPVLRIYAESHTDSSVEQLLDEGVLMAQTQIDALYAAAV